MPESGKVDRQFFQEHIASRLGAVREDIHRGPAHGVDFGVIDADEQAVVMATDPLSILPELGYERAGRFAIQFVLADVAVSGLSPSHLAVSFSLPPELRDEEFAAMWEGIHRECQDLGVAIVTGHTARYEGCSLPWIGHGTGVAFGQRDELIYPDGAQPGDSLLVTRGPAVESTGLLTTLFPGQLSLAESDLQQAQSLLEETDVVRDAIAVGTVGGVNAMHDATEGGLLGAFHELAASAGVQLHIDTEAVPIRPGVVAASEALGLDIWRATTAGTLLIAARPGATEAVVETLESRDTPVGVVGEVVSGHGVVLDGEEVGPPRGDSSWRVYERLLEESDLS